MNFDWAAASGQWLVKTLKTGLAQFRELVSNFRLQRFSYGGLDRQCRF